MIPSALLSLPGFVAHQGTSLTELETSASLRASKSKHFHIIYHIDSAVGVKPMVNGVSTHYELLVARVVLRGKAQYYGPTADLRLNCRVE